MDGTGYMAISVIGYLNSILHPPQRFLHPVSLSDDLIAVQLPLIHLMFDTVTFLLVFMHCCLPFMEIVCVINKLTCQPYLMSWTFLVLWVSSPNPYKNILLHLHVKWYLSMQTVVYRNRKLSIYWITIPFAHLKDVWESDYGRHLTGYF